VYFGAGRSAHHRRRNIGLRIEIRVHTALSIGQVQVTRL
jgi:hypothetical protein